MDRRVPLILDSLRLAGTLDKKALVRFQALLLSSAAERRGAERFDSDVPFFFNQSNQPRDPFTPSLVFRKRRHNLKCSIVVCHTNVPITDFFKQMFVKLP